MSVVSFEFLGFLAALAVVYYVLPMRVRKWALLAGSAAFWLLCGWQGAAYLTAETLLIWGCARLMGRFSERRGVCRALLVGGMVTVFGAMVLMKALAQLQALPDGLLVPIGLSYFTFQSVGYLIDVYRGKVTPEKNYAKVLLFASFFPQMTQGPITTWKQLMPQLDSPHRLSPNGFVSGVFLMAWGFFKKLVIADRLMPAVSVLVAAAQELPGWLVLATAAMYAIVLYADFSGGIDIIRGAAELLGIDLPENFRRPFFAASIADYWRRWHISLGAWMRDYVFYPFALTRPVSRMSKALKKKAGTHIARALPAALGRQAVAVLLSIVVMLGCFVGFGGAKLRAKYDTVKNGFTTGVAADSGYSLNEELTTRLNTAANIITTASNTLGADRTEVQTAQAALDSFSACLGAVQSDGKIHAPDSLSVYTGGRMHMLYQSNETLGTAIGQLYAKLQEQAADPMKMGAVQGQYSQFNSAQTIISNLHYNDAVQSYQKDVGGFPASVLGKLFGIQEVELFA